MRGRAAFCAPWYHALHPVPPREVDLMKPTQIAAVLGLDRVLAVIADARPLLDSEVTDTGTEPIEWQMTPRPGVVGEQTLHKVVKFGG